MIISKISHNGSNNVQIKNILFIRPVAIERDWTKIELYKWLIISKIYYNGSNNVQIKNILFIRSVAIERDWTKIELYKF